MCEERQRRNRYHRLIEHDLCRHFSDGRVGDDFGNLD
jgi:hypothetical protein